MIRRALAALRAWRTQPVTNLLTTPLLAEITVHVRPGGDRQLYVSRNPLTPEADGELVEAMLLATLDLAQARHVVLNPDAVAMLLRQQMPQRGA